MRDRTWPARHTRTTPMLALMLGLFASAFVAGCDKPQVDWTDPVAVKAPDGALLTLDTAGHALFIPPPARAGTLPAAAGLCASSFVTGQGPRLFNAAWWSVRPDSSAVLEVASSLDSGKTWGRTVAVDTSDIASTGCRRPPPSLTTVGDDVYVAYSMVAPEGKGVFFAHSMGGMMHAPVPVIYGERLVATAITADAHRVAVAYEEPNGTREQVDVALSGTQGHLFEVHTPASRGVDVATAPTVAFAGTMLAVSWLERRRIDGGVSRVVRVGRMLPWS